MAAVSSKKDSKGEAKTQPPNTGPVRGPNAFGRAVMPGNAIGRRKSTSRWPKRPVVDDACTVCGEEVPKVARTPMHAGRGLKHWSCDVCLLRWTRAALEKPSLQPSVDCPMCPGRFTVDPNVVRGALARQGGPEAERVSLLFELRVSGAAEMPDLARCPTAGCPTVGFADPGAHNAWCRVCQLCWPLSPADRRPHERQERSTAAWLAVTGHQCPACSVCVSLACRPAV